MAARNQGGPVAAEPKVRLVKHDGLVAPATSLVSSVIAGGLADWRFFDEALEVLPERVIQGLLAGGVNGIDLAVMGLIWGHETDPGRSVPAGCPATTQLFLDVDDGFEARQAPREARRGSP